MEYLYRDRTRYEKGMAICRAEIQSAVRVDLALEHAQHSHARQSQATLGTGKGSAGDELGGMCNRRLSLRSDRL
jgi:hypothetical protein